MKKIVPTLALSALLSACGGGGGGGSGGKTPDTPGSSAGISSSLASSSKTSSIISSVSSSVRSSIANINTPVQITLSPQIIPYHLSPAHITPKLLGRYIVQENISLPFIDTNNALNISYSLNEGEIRHLYQDMSIETIPAGSSLEIYVGVFDYDFGNTVTGKLEVFGGTRTLEISYEYTVTSPNVVVPENTPEVNFEQIPTQDTLALQNQNIPLNNLLYTSSLSSQEIPLNFELSSLNNLVEYYEVYGYEITASNPNSPQKMKKSSNFELKKLLTVFKNGTLTPENAYTLSNLKDCSVTFVNTGVQLSCNYKTNTSDNTLVFLGFDREKKIITHKGLEIIREEKTSGSSSSSSSSSVASSIPAVSSSSSSSSVASSIPAVSSSSSSSSVASSITSSVSSSVNSSLSALRAELSTTYNNNQANKFIQANYTQKSWNLYLEALENAQNTLTNPSLAFDSKYENADFFLKYALAEMGKYDISELNTTLESVSSYTKLPNYHDTVWSTFETVVQEANTTKLEGTQNDIYIANNNIKYVKNILDTAPAQNYVNFSWGLPNKRENCNRMTPIELGGYEIRYKHINDNSFTYVTIDSYEGNQTKYLLPLASTTDYSFQIAVFDKNGLYSVFGDINKDSSPNSSSSSSSASCDS